MLIKKINNFFVSVWFLCSLFFELYKIAWKKMKKKIPAHPILHLKNSFAAMSIQRKSILTLKLVYSLNHFIKSDVPNSSSFSFLFYYFNLSLIEKKTPKHSNIQKLWILTHYTFELPVSNSNTTFDVSGNKPRYILGWCDWNG